VGGSEVEVVLKSGLGSSMGLEPLPGQTLIRSVSAQRGTSGPYPTSIASQP